MKNIIIQNFDQTLKGVIICFSGPDVTYIFWISWVSIRVGPKYSDNHSMDKFSVFKLNVRLVTVISLLKCENK